MNLKSFLTASLIIHIIGGLALYFYYNPITLSPQPIQQLEENQEAEELAEILPAAESADPPKKQPAPWLKKQSSAVSGLSKKKISTPADILKNKEDLTLKRQKRSSKGPELSAGGSQEPFRETEDSPVDLQLEEITEDDGPVPLNKSAGQSSNRSKEGGEDNPSGQNPPLKTQAAQNALPAPLNLEDFEEVETAPPQTNRQNPPLKTQAAQNALPAPPNLEDFEEVETAPPQTNRQNPLLKTQAAQNALPAPPNLEDFEEVETAPPQTNRQNPPLKTQAAQNALPAPPNLEDFEEVETAPPQTNRQNQIPKEPSPSAGNVGKDSSIQKFQNLPQKLGNPPLTYPDFARRAKMQGTVSVLFFVNKQGLVDKIQLESSSGHSELDNFVIRTLARYEFLVRQETWVRYKIPFILEGAEIERLKLRNK